MLSFPFYFFPVTAVSQLVTDFQLLLLGYSTDAAAAAAIVYFNIAANPQPGRLLPVNNTLKDICFLLLIWGSATIYVNYYYVSYVCFNTNLRVRCLTA